MEPTKTEIRTFKALSTNEKNQIYSAFLNKEERADILERFKITNVAFYATIDEKLLKHKQDKRKNGSSVNHFKGFEKPNYYLTESEIFKSRDLLYDPRELVGWELKTFLEKFD